MSKLNDQWLMAMEAGEELEFAQMISRCPCCLQDVCSPNCESLEEMAEEYA